MALGISQAWTQSGKILESPIGARRARFACSSLATTVSYKWTKYVTHLPGLQLLNLISYRKTTTAAPSGSNMTVLWLPLSRLVILTFSSWQEQPSHPSSELANDSTIF